MYDTSTPGVVVDKVTGLMWQRAVDASGYTQGDAQTHCAGLTLAGYCDWRLPTRIELVSLVDFTTVGPAVDPTAFPGVNGTPSWAFWTSSPVAASPSNAWRVDFGVGYTSSGGVTDANSVRCVR